MKRSFTLVCLLASATGVGLTTSPNFAFAQAPSAPSAPAPANSTAGLSAAPAVPASAKIAIINFQQAVAATNEGQRNFAQLRVKFEPKQAQLKAQSDEIDSLKKQLQDAGANLSEPERDSRLRVIDEKTKSLQRSAEDAQNEASGAMNDMYQALAQKVYAVLDTYSAQNKFTLVLDTSAQQTPVLWANGSTDITKADCRCLQCQVRRSAATSSRRHRSAPQHNQPQPAVNDHPSQHDQAAAVAAVVHFSVPPGKIHLPGGK